jgi:hypothetical protein
VEKFLFYGNDKFSQPLQLKWMWDSDNVAAFSNDAGIFNGSISQASYSNPITAIFNNPESLSRVLCSTTFFRFNRRHNHQPAAALRQLHGQL